MYFSEDIQEISSYSKEIWFFMQFVQTKTSIQPPTLFYLVLLDLTNHTQLITSTLPHFPHIFKIIFATIELLVVKMANHYPQSTHKKDKSLSTNEWMLCQTERCNFKGVF